MAEAIVVATGLDGKPSIWPAKAVSKSADGVFRDYRGRVVPLPGVAMDSTDANSHARRKSVGNDTSLEDALMDKLFPTLRRMVDEAMAAEGEDGVEEEAKALGLEGEDEAITSSYAEGISSYADAKAYWNGVNERSRAGRSRAYAPPAANASKGH
jgi:hypothetical protein